MKQTRKGRKSPSKSNGSQDVKFCPCCGEPIVTDNRLLGVVCYSYRELEGRLLEIFRDPVTGTLEDYTPYVEKLAEICTAYCVTRVMGDPSDPQLDPVEIYCWHDEPEKALAHIKDEIEAFKLLKSL